MKMFKTLLVCTVIMALVYVNVDGKPAGTDELKQVSDDQVNNEENKLEWMSQGDKSGNKVYLEELHRVRRNDTEPTKAPSGPTPKPGADSDKPGADGDTAADAGATSTTTEETSGAFAIGYGATMLLTSAILLI